MPIRVQCSGCQNTLKVPEKFAGKRIRCPVCQTAVNVSGEPVAPSDTATDSLAVTSAVPKLPLNTDGAAVAEEETYRLSEPEPDPASEPAPPARVVGKKVRAKSDRVGGRSDDNFEAPSRRSRVTVSNSATEGGWRDHLIWFLLVAIWAGAVAILMRENQDHLFHDGFDWEDALNFLVQYLLIAMVLHGLYDTLLKRDHHLLALAIAAGNFAWLGWLASNRRREEAA